MGIGDVSKCGSPNALLPLTLTALCKINAARSDFAQRPELLPESAVASPMNRGALKRSSFPA